MNPIISINNVTKIFKKHYALNDVSFSVSEGSFHSICGENGSGKSTIIKIMIGSYSPKKYSGFIKMDPKNSISYIPEVTFFPRGKTTYNYLLNIALLLSNDKNEAEVKVNNALKEMGIVGLAHKHPNKFSSGQKKKVALARVALENCNLLILDEPAANLDFTSRDFLFNKLSEWNKNGKTIILVSHLVNEIEKYVNEMTLIHYGQMICNKKIKLGSLGNEYSSELKKYTDEELKKGK